MSRLNPAGRAVGGKARRKVGKHLAYPVYSASSYDGRVFAAVEKRPETNSPAS